jgi:NAD(P)-dependent dehydrogenase (short-subunit alcohol dehydrogenase family)
MGVLAREEALSISQASLPLWAVPPHVGHLPPLKSPDFDIQTAVYCASKAAVMAMTRADAIDYSSSGIRVNCICPGIIETPMTMGDEKSIKGNKPYIEMAPMKRIGQPVEVADCALFLSSTRASFVQGHAMVVDGGVYNCVGSQLKGDIYVGCH